LNRTARAYDRAAGSVRAGCHNSEARVTSEGDICLIRALEYENVLRACLYRITRNLQDVEELLQETYARLLVTGEAQKPPPESMRAFALAIARNVGLDWLRRRRIVPIELMEDMAKLEVLDEGEQVEEIVNLHQELLLLRSAIERLPARCCEVFTLRRVYGMSQKEVARELDIAEHTVERHLGRALHRLTEVFFNSPAPSSALLDRLMKRTKVKGHD